MHRQDVYEYLQLYEAFLTAETGVKITDIDPATERVEIQTPAPNGSRFWTDYWSASKTIEALSN